MASVDCVLINTNSSDTDGENGRGLLYEGGYDAGCPTDQMSKHLGEPLSYFTECELPENLKIATSGQYFEFEQVANGIDGYFDENSDTDDENFGENEDDSFSFNMCRVRQPRSLLKNNLPEIYHHTKPKNDEVVERIDADDICKEVEEEGLDPEDVLCTVRENYAKAPPLAQEDDFDFDV